MTAPVTSALLYLDNITVSFDGFRALNALSLTVDNAEMRAIIGPNGAGKTSLLNVLNGVYRPSSGSVTFQGESLLGRKPAQIAALGIARTFQNLALIHGMTVRDNVLLGAHHRARAGLVGSALSLPGVRSEERKVREEAQEVLERLELADIAHCPASGLPYGTLKRIELARALCGRPQLLMLDEPASGLSHGEVDTLADLILSLRDDLGLTILLVEHHMGMVMRISDSRIVLDHGSKIAVGPPAEVQRDEAVVNAYLGAEE
jgi:branched-chain amino acid transport system ATP-binding protein